LDLSLVILIVSLVSAFCFAFGGFLLGRSWDGPKDPPPIFVWEDEVLAEAKAEVERLKEGIEKRSLDLEQGRKREDELREKIERAMEMMEALERVTTLPESNRPSKDPVQDRMHRTLDGSAKLELDRQKALYMEVEESKEKAEKRERDLAMELEAAKKKVLRSEEELRRRREQMTDLQAEVARLTSRMEGAAYIENERIRLEEQMEAARQSIRSLNQDLEKERLRRVELESVAARADEERQANLRLQAELDAVNRALSAKRPPPLPSQTGRFRFGEEVQEAKNAGIDFTGVSSLRDILNRLVSLPGITAAVVADDHGLLIEGAKGEEDNEALAAITTLLSELPGLLSEGVKLSTIPSEVTVADNNGIALVTRFFNAGGSRCTLAVATTDQHAARERTERAIQAIQAFL